MVLGGLLAALLAAFAPGARAARWPREGADGVYLVQHTLQAETEKSSLTNNGKPLAGKFYDDTVTGIDLGNSDNAPASKFDDDAKVPVPKFYDKGQLPARSFYDDGKAPAPSFRDDDKGPAKPTYSQGKPLAKDEKTLTAQIAAWKPKVPVPQYKLGEQAEVITLTGEEVGSWVPCTIKGFSQMPGAYDIYLPYAPEGYRYQPHIPGKLLRKDKPDSASLVIAEEAEALAASVKQRQQKLRDEGAKAKLRMQSQITRVVKGAPKDQSLPKDKEIGMRLVSHGVLSGPAARAAQKFKPPAAAPPMPSPQEELQKWLQTSGKQLDPETLRKLWAKAGTVSKERPKVELEQVAELQATHQHAAVPRRSAEEEQLELANDPVMNGSWTRAKSGEVFRIRNITCGLVFESEGITGSLRQEGEWLVGNLTFVSDTSKPPIMLRIRRGKEPGTSVGNLRFAGDRHWGSDLVARRTGRTHDELPGLCPYESYGCKCIDGKLKQPPIFWASAGEEVRIFKTTGEIGWYPCTILGWNRTTFLYTVFVPQGSPNYRILGQVPPQVLRHVKDLPPPKQEQTEASSARVELDRSPPMELGLKRAQTQPRTPSGEAAQTPVMEKEARVVGNQNVQNDTPRNSLVAGGLASWGS